MRSAMTPQGKGIIVGYGTITDWQTEAYRVAIPGLPAKWIDAGQCELLPERANGHTDDEIEAWMRRQSSPASRRAHEWRMRSQHRKASAPTPVSGRVPSRGVGCVG